MLKNPKYVYGPPQIQVPGNINFGEFLLHSMMSRKDKIAITNAITKENMTYGEIAQLAMNAAVSLYEIGVRKGTTVAFCSENRDEYWGAVLGVMCTGAVATPFNPGYAKAELNHVLNITRPKYLICSLAAFKAHEKTFRSHDFLKQIILFGDEKFRNTLLFKDLVTPNIDSRVLKRDVIFEEFQVADVMGQTDTIFVLYSSGTTGLPKGVMLTHLNFLLCCISFNTPEERPGDTLTFTPWFHAMGLMSCLGFMSVGRRMVYLPKFEVDLYLKTIEEYRIPVITVVPPVLVALGKTQSKYDLSCVREISCGAAPLYKETVNELSKIFPSTSTVYQAYGMTETTLGVLRASIDGLCKPGSVGVVVAGMIAKIVDPESGKVLGPNETGEICVKGGLAMKGYIGKDRRDDFDREGFFRTGDIGYYDEDRYFFIVDRLKELIKYKGYQVAPAEIEAVLLQHEAVRDAGVVGLENKSVGEVPVAFIVTQPGRKVTEQELKDFVAERLSNPKQLRGGVRFVDQIPKNPSGKILRRVLKTMVKKQKSKL